MTTPATAVDRYLAAQPPPVRAALSAVRRAIQKGLPGAEEVISYRIPAYRVAGRVAIFFAGWKRHYSLYPATAALVAHFAADLSGCDISKGTIRFALDKPVPSRLIQRLAAFRGKETVALAAAAKAKKAGTPARPKARTAARVPAAKAR